MFTQFDLDREKLRGLQYCDVNSNRIVLQEAIEDVLENRQMECATYPLTAVEAFDISNWAVGELEHNSQANLVEIFNYVLKGNPDDGGGQAEKAKVPSRGPKPAGELALSL